MSPEAIKQMQEENAALKADKAKDTAKIAELEGTITKKDELIEQKNQDIVGARRKYKKLDELTDEEKASMSEADIERKRDQDALFEQQEEMRVAQEETRGREISERKLEAVKKFAGEDAQLQTKLLANFDKIKGADSAYTPGEIAEFMGTAFNMLGDERPEPVRQANNQGGGVAPVVGENAERAEGGFADTPAGQTLAESMGLHSATAPADGAK